MLLCEIRATRAAVRRSRRQQCTEAIGSKQKFGFRAWRKAAKATAARRARLAPA
jgi:hypothetical protein